MGRNAMGQCLALPEPLRLCLAIFFHVLPALSPTDHSAQGNDENIEQPVPGIRTPGITHMRKSVKQARGSGFFHGHSFSTVTVNRRGGHGYPGKGVCSILKCAYPGIPTSSLDTPQKSCDNGEKAIEDT